MSRNHMMTMHRRETFQQNRFEPEYKASRQTNEINGFQPGILSDYVSLNCRQATEKYRKSLTRSKQHGRQPSLVEGQPQYDALDASGRPMRHNDAILNMEDIRSKGGLTDMDGSTVGTSHDASTYCNTCHNPSRGHRRRQQRTRNSSGTLGRWFENPQKQSRNGRVGSLNSVVSTDHAECLRFSMRSLSSSNTLQTMATTTANSQGHSASCSPTFSQPASLNSSMRKSMSRNSASRSNFQSTNPSSSPRRATGWFNLFQTCLNNESKTCEGASDVTTNRACLECAIPEDEPAATSVESHIRRVRNTSTKTSTHDFCLPVPEWLTRFFESCKRPSAFHADSLDYTSGQMYSQKHPDRSDGFSLDSTFHMSTGGHDHTEQSVGPGRSTSTCSVVSDCSCDDDSSSSTRLSKERVLAGASLSAAQDKRGSFCTSGTGSSIVDRTPDQVMLDEEIEETDSNNISFTRTHATERASEAVVDLAIPKAIRPECTSNVVPEVSPIGVSFVNQFSEASPLRNVAVTMDVTPQPLNKKATQPNLFAAEKAKTAEEVAAICHFEQALKYERTSYLDASLVSLHDALRCCESSPKPLPILHCRIMQSKSVLQWKLGRYESAIQTLQWTIDTLSELPTTLNASFAESLEATLLLSESHRQLAIVHMSCGTNSYKESVEQLQMSLKVCRQKMMQVQELKRKAVRKLFSSQLLHSIAHSLTVLGSIQKEKGNYTKAMSLFQRGLQILVQQEAASPPTPKCERSENEQRENMMMYRSNSALIAHTLNHMGEVFQFQYSDSHRAMDMYSEALWLYRVCLGHQHVDVAMTMLHMGQVHMEWNEFLEAKEAFSEALKVFENILGSSHRNVATTLWYMAQMELLEHNFCQALEHFEESLEIQRQCLGDFHPDVAATYHAMARLYEEAEQPQYALQLYNYAWQINKHNFGKEHSDSLSVAWDMARINALFKRQRHEQIFALR